MAADKISGFTCPLPLQKYPEVQLAHGGGGSLMRELIEDCFRREFDNPKLNLLQDSAVLELGNARLAFTTDSYVVSPLFFPGGDIGSLAVNGTLNDLAMVGAKPLYMSAAFILEAGFPMTSLGKIVASMKAAACKAGIEIVTGDTKVVERGKGDGIYLNTAGIGIVKTELTIGPSALRTGDRILLNGDLGRHGIAVMAKREGLEFETDIESDCADLSGLVIDLLEAGIEIHCMRDLTRGGLASALVEISQSAGQGIFIHEDGIMVSEAVNGACEILGLDPLYIANEGRMVCFIPPDDAKKALEIMRAHPLGADASIIGEVGGMENSRVAMRNKIGTSRIIDLLSGEQLPRIC